MPVVPDQPADNQQGRMPLQNQTITYEADGIVLKSQLFFEPATQARAGVLVFPEAFGLGEHAISRAQRLATLGYAALACDIHGGGRLIGDLQEAIAALGPLYAETSRMRARGLGGLKALQ